jgi:bifunctional UDP-N-acetylglucosamine pyrophosphorylase/glucosamine-1-phosphate N-acetyltransferase
MNLSVVILAAGKGKRMRSHTPKVLHEALGKPLLQHVLDAVSPLRPAKTIVVIGNGAQQVIEKMDDGTVRFVIQKRLLGTGNALAVARRELGRGPVIVLNGDGPLITTKTLKTLIRRHAQSGNLLSFLTFVDDSMSGYGRVIRDERGNVTAIKEDKHTTRAEKQRFRELNGGIYLMEQEVLHYLGRIRKNSGSGEYYITDIVSLVSAAGRKLDAYDCPKEEIRGVNNRRELYEVSEIMRRTCISKWMEKGVTFLDPGTSIVHSSVKIGRDSVIYPNTYLEGNTSLGKKCVIYPGTRIIDSGLGSEVTIKDNTLIEKSRIRDGAVIGPFAHLRPHTIVGRNAKIGNFVELKKASVGDGTKASHLSYLGDAEIGNNVNIGAGTITCNYDGTNKFKTTIEPHVFIGSDSQLVAPVTIGRGAYVAAGATITQDVPPGALAISRPNQQNLENWVRTRSLKARNRNMKTKKGEKGAG